MCELTEVNKPNSSELTHVRTELTPVRRRGNVRVTCTHDAGLRKLLPQLKNSRRATSCGVRGTSDEMRTGILIATPAT